MGCAETTAGVHASTKDRTIARIWSLIARQAFWIQAFWIQAFWIQAFWIQAFWIQAFWIKARPTIYHRIPLVTASQYRESIHRGISRESACCGFSQAEFRLCAFRIGRVSTDRHGDLGIVPRR